MWKTIVDGGITMIPLIACSIFGLAVILERRKSLKEATIDVGPFRQQLEALLTEGRVDSAIERCHSTPGPVAAILGVGLHRYAQMRRMNRADDDIEQGVIRAMEDYSPHVVATLEKYLIVLITVANIAPLFGFLGTVTGMINAFDAIAKAGGMRPDVVASGIAEALITTAAGLFIGIPAMVAYNYFTGRVEKFVLEIQESATKLLEVLTMKGASA
jgi:biopolymer transport protein ExbB